MIAIGSDHGGYELKEAIKGYLDSEKIPYRDYGTYSTEAVDYSDIGVVVAKAVASGECDLGIVICGTGIGISIAANKVPGIRAALCTDTYMARMAREHNNANVLALGGRVLGIGLALDIVKTFMETPFSHEARHQRRIDKINAIEEEYKE
ncbi:sugar-phosphate isomerase, RpiB/LacA/LacB family [Thermoclostridium stercorarium subsp. stercorarium DSM 8532]|uniref:Sugar-phosphate isomerase, RpiB/LacA/LacB family n=2 Tax=Thermoclostridium stercorarium TaxID=1510 RepID=L7VT11_THES1|nr:ribose 5-phosphate isomerase B [Thermoclostridium stercorarium]AGC69516.1 sugar-phosphate isomerase, RpiB/LacA/LacB family [Thermoclostridium stercorarium subsp. stercorarium DSM 8532]AGI40468.1 RpiB [Thermoclostridium stercorarium subsp. stercorarium DSM 8532]ANX02377.1 ribose-5-phosphate isomerase [Thermoclostridium stercorarium subsp. leptospartum DSM 9219]